MPVIRCTNPVTRDLASAMSDCSILKNRGYVAKILSKASGGFSTVRNRSVLTPHRSPVTSRCHLQMEKFPSTARPEPGEP